MYSFTNYLIMYDISDNKRLNRARTILREYCFQEQHSIFESKLRKSQIIALSKKLEKAIDKEKDCVIIYPLTRYNILNKITLGKRKYKKSLIFCEL